MQISKMIALFLILASILASGTTLDLSQHPPNPATIQQTSPQQYVTFLPKAPGPSPWVLYPTTTVVWVAGQSSGNPPESQIREYVVSDGTSKVILTLPNASINSIIQDDSGKVWFAVNSTLRFYDSVHGTFTNETTFPNESLQYLALDHQDRLWITMTGPKGASSVVMWDHPNNLNKTYPVPTNNSAIQGIAVAPAPDNTIWFAEAGSRKFGRVACDACTIEEFSPPSSLNLLAPIQVAVDTSGNLWFTDHGGDNQFGEFNPHSNAWKTLPIGYCPDACVSGLPNAIFVDSKDTVWFSEHIAGRIAHYDPLTGVLVEYAVQSSTLPLIWWARPAPNNLVWFVAWNLGEVGYVNASMSLPLTLSGLTGDILVQRGSSQNVQVQAGFQGTGVSSFGISPLTQDQASSQSTSQVFGSAPSDIGPSGSPQRITFHISAAWNATLGARYVALTASNGQIAVSTHVRVVVVEAAAPFVAIGFSSIVALGGLMLYLRRPKKPKLQPARKVRR